MSKSKKKRRKLDKLLRKRQLWEWLEQIEKHDPKAIGSEPWLEVWKSLCREAFRYPDYLETFWEREGSLSRHPDLPELKLIRLAKAFLDGRDVSREVAALEGLSASARVFQEKLLAWQKIRFPRRELSVFLKRMATNPQKVTARTYHSFASLIDGLPGLEFLSQQVTELAISLAELRRWNRKSIRKEGWRGVASKNPRALDATLNTALEILPCQSLSPLLAPFGAQGALLFTRLLEEEGPRTVAQAATKLPHLFRLAAGTRHEDMKEVLANLDPGMLGTIEPEELQRKIQAADFEERLVLLSRLRSAILAQAEEEDIRWGSFWDDYEDEDGGEHLIPAFRGLYWDVLQEIGRKRKSFDPRETKTLAQMLDPILEKDLFLMGEEEDVLARTLTLAARAGVLGPRLCILAMMVGARVKNRDLIWEAKGSLKDLPTPNRNEVAQVLQHFHWIYCPFAGALRPLRETLDDFSSLVPDLARRLRDRLVALLLKATASDEFDHPMSFLLKTITEDDQEEFLILSQELRYFKDEPGFAMPLAYAESFPGFRLTSKGFGRLVERMYGICGGFAPLIEDFALFTERCVSAELHNAGPLLSDTLHNILPFYRKALFAFLDTRWEPFKAASPDTLETLVNTLELLMNFSEQEQAVLLKLVNLLGERASAGDPRAAFLRERVMDRLVAARQRTKQRRRRRRRWL